MKFTEKQDNYLRENYNDSMHVDPSFLAIALKIPFNSILIVINRLYELGLRKHRRYDTQ